MEQVTVGKLSFERRTEADGDESIVVTRATNKDAYATYTLCGDDAREWNYLKKNCWPANGVGAKAPAGRWVLLEYIGRERSSRNLEPEKSVEDGFTDRELLRLTATVNAIFGEDDVSVVQLEPEQPKKRKRRSRGNEL